MKKLTTLILVGLAIYTTAGAVPAGVTMPAAEREGVAKCKNRCVEEEQHCTVECKKEDRGHKRYLECTHECSTDKIRCNKECVSDAK